MKDLLEKLKPLLGYLAAGLIAAGLVSAGKYIPGLDKMVCEKIPSQESAK